jgi:predicted metalloprotease with PDZ domain
MPGPRGVTLTPLAIGSRCLIFGMLFGAGFHAPAQTAKQLPGPIIISVDATDVAQKILHAELSIPAKAGSLTLYYPKWMPADHSPDGPIWNVAGLKFSAAGKSIPWSQDSVDMYAFHVEVPQGTKSVTAKLDFLLSAPGPTIDFSASGTARLFVLMWNQVVLYPSGWPASQIMFQPKLTVPLGWTFHTALPVAEQSSETITFKSVALDLLIDSPVQSGAYTKVIRLSPGNATLNEIDLAADSNSALDIPPTVIDNYKHLVEEAQALYQSHHYREYHFLLTLSDNIMELGQEHHESSDDRVPANALSDPNQRLLGADLLTHEFTHSWNGQYRRPEGLATPDFQQPMQGELLWVYEGLTTYLGTVLAARSGLWNAEQTRERLALLASTLDHRAGRTWRSLENTSRAAQILYFAPSEWASYRRGTDFYPESVLIWLEADVTIRKLTDGHRSLDDFCRTFLGGPEVMPVVKTFNFDDLVTAMNEVAAFDWRSFFVERLQSVDARAPLGGLVGGGWQLTYSDEPNQMIAASQAAARPVDYTSSIGVLVKADGTVQDAIPGMPAYQRGIRPYTRVLAVNGRQFSPEELNKALAESKKQTGTIVLLVSNAGFVESHEIDYHDGLRYPHLVRNETVLDYLDEILKPRVTQ